MCVGTILSLCAEKSSRLYGERTHRTTSSHHRFSFKKIKHLREMKEEKRLICIPIGSKATYGWLFLLRYNFFGWISPLFEKSVLSVRLYFTLTSLFTSFLARLITLVWILGLTKLFLKYRVYSFTSQSQKSEVGNKSRHGFSHLSLQTNSVKWRKQPIVSVEFFVAWASTFHNKVSWLETINIQWLYLSYFLRPPSGYNWTRGDDDGHQRRCDKWICSKLQG